MDTAFILSLLHESIYLIAVFGFFLVVALWQGRYVLINVILSLYPALLLTVKFPYFTQLSSGNATNDTLVRITLFISATIIGFLIFRRHIPGDDFEKTFSSLGKKILLVLMATSLVMAFSYHALPISEFLQPGTPIQTLFAPEGYFFWWLAAPLVILLFV
jgi:hypothetical protein